MKKYAKKISVKDNVVTAVNDFKAGEEVTVLFKNSKNVYKCNQDIPFGHKVAIMQIAKGDKIIKYGEAIGKASVDIMTGDWVHIHNVKDDYMCLDKEGNPLPGQDE